MQLALDGEQVEPGGHGPVEEVGLGEGQVGRGALGAQRAADQQVLAAAQQIAFPHADLGQRTGDRRPADSEAEFAGGLLLHVHLDDGAVGGALRGHIDHVHLLEEGEVADALARAAQFGGIEGVALHQAELAADDLVQRAGIAGDVDALDIDPGAFLDIVGDVDGLGFAIARHLRLHVDERVALRAHRVGQLLDDVLDLVGVVPLAALGNDQRFQLAGLEVAQLHVDRRLAELVAVALVDGEGDEEAFAVGGQLRHGRGDAEIGEALLQVVAAQQFAVIGDAIRVVIVVGRQESVPPLFLGLQDFTQLRVGVLAVADEIDALDQGRRTFGDLEHQVDAVLLQLDDLRLDGGGEAAVAAIQFEDALDVVLDLGAGVDHARPQLRLGLHLLVLEALVTLEGDAVDDGVLDDPHDQIGSVPADGDVGEQAGVEQGLQRLVHALGVVDVALGDGHVGLDSLDLDALRPLDDDLAYASRFLREGRQCGGQQKADHQSGPPNQTHKGPLRVPSSLTVFRLPRTTVSPHPKWARRQCRSG